MRVSDTILRDFYIHTSPSPYTLYRTRLDVINSFKQNLRYKKFLVLPYKNKEIELPLSLLNCFSHNIPSSDTNVVIPLFRTSNLCFASGSTIINHLHDDNFPSGGLASLRCVNDKFNAHCHYGTLGAIFNLDFVPEFMCSWKCRVDECGHLCTVQPIARISPAVFQQKDSISSTICNTVFKNIIGKSVMDPITTSYFPLSVVIEDWPYSLIHPQKPDIRTNDEELKQLVLDNMEEFKIEF